MDAINRRIMLLRKARGLTMKQVAATIEVPVSTYRDWEYGRTIQGAAYLKLAAIFKVPLYELMTGEKPKYHHVLDHIENAEIALTKAREEISALL